MFVFFRGKDFYYLQQSKQNELYLNTDSHWTKSMVYIKESASQFRNLDLKDLKSFVRKQTCLIFPHYWSINKLHFFNSSFRSTVKMNRKYREFPYFFFLFVSIHECSTINIPNWNGTLEIKKKKNELALTYPYHPKSTLCIRVHS